MLNFVAPDHLCDGGFASQVHAFKNILWIILNIAQVFQVAPIGQAIEVYQSAYFRLVDDVSDQIRADKPCTARYEQIHLTPGTYCPVPPGKTGALHYPHGNPRVTGSGL